MLAKKAGTTGKKGITATSLSSGKTALAPAGTVPHYFGPYPNWANSPLPKGSITTISVDDGGSGYTAPNVVIADVYGTGADAAATAVVTDGIITAIVITNPGSNYSAPYVAISDPTGTGALASARIGGVLTGGLKKFVDQLPGLGPSGIPVATWDDTTYPGSDYYEIALVEYFQKFHRDLPPTRLRGYVQLSTSKVPGAQVPLTYPDGRPILVNGVQALGVTEPRYLGPLILATKDRPVRVLFRNLLPTKEEGNLFIPVDTSLMGSGMGPDMGGTAEPDPQNLRCGATPKPMECFTENRATLHLHGGLTPWISDGTPHQWITPAGEGTPYPKGVSVSNVPDMPDPGDGAQTFFYTNQQSARLMFYHDHAWGVTRLNVYAGEAAGYLLRDDKERELLRNNLLPHNEIPLIIQDKTFVDASTIAAQDPTWHWNLDAEGNPQTGQLWVPHVYMPAQNPNDPTGASAFGRWMYGAWFWPPQTNMKYPPISNPYYDPSCDQDVTGWCEPPLIPGTPNNSVGMEAFNDTPIVNGIAYPDTTVLPDSYRFRILNAANDRFWNLQWYVADATGTEVALKASELEAAQIDPNVFPTPDTAISPAGPNWIQIGTEGGFLPMPVVVPNQPTTWIIDPTRFDVGNVDKHSLLLGPAERADVIVDFSAFKGKTLILYNDAPAAFPARVATYDYYTGNPDMTDGGGTPPTQPGYGPNTRTIMRVHVLDTTPAPAFALAALQAEFAHHLDGEGKPAGVFESTQDPIIVGQGAYNQALGTNFRNTAPRDGFARIADMSLKFNTLKTGNSSTDTLTVNFENKGLHDEMNSATFDEYGRMTANLGLESPGATPLLQNIVLYPYVNPATEIIKEVTAVGPIATADDGTQIWKLTHNGVDTHPIHFHLFDVQLVNRVTWDNRILPPEATELGWKETVRVSPLEDTIVALRPKAPKLPFGVPDSFRRLNPAMPPDTTEGFNSIDVQGNAMVPPITNAMVNFGWEYVWHCHILGHEEMDMMRPISFSVARALPAAPVVSLDSSGNDLLISWTDGTPNPPFVSELGNPQNEIGYRIERAPVDNGVVGTYENLGSALANVTTFTTATAGTYSYRVIAFNAAGDSVSAPVLDVPPSATPSPTQLDFAYQLVNTTGAPLTFTLTNNGGRNLLIGNVAISGTNSGDFALTNGCGATLIAAASCNVSITFKPSASGARQASLLIDSNDPANPTLTVSLIGSGATPAVLLTPAPSSTLTSYKVPFTWDGGIGATAYQLTVGTTAGATDIYDSGEITATSTIASPLPVNASTVHVRLRSQINGAWLSNDYTYTSFTALPLTVKAANASRAYGAANPTFTGTVTGLVNGDTVTMSFTTVADPTSPVGTYSIVPSLVDPNGVLGNYAVSAVNGTLTVTKASLVITASNVVRLFGDPNPTLTGTIVGLKNADPITATYSTTADVNSPVGTYPIVPAMVDPNGKAVNYNVTLTNGSLIIRSMPVSVSVTPNNGTARTAVMQFAYSDAAGFASITSTQIMINATQSFAGSCGLRYTAAGNTLEAINDNGVGWSVPVAIGTVGGVVQNSQCSVSLGSSSVITSGNNLTLSLSVTFKTSFQGLKNIYMNATNKFANTSATVNLGTWTLSTTPTNVSVTPSSGTARTQVFQFVYADALGFSSITSTQSLINASNTFTKACGLRYIAASNSAQITTDDGVSWSALLPLGQAGTLANSQCSVNMAQSSAAGSANNLTVSYAITFDPNFVGTKNIYELATNKFGNSSQLQQKGTWTLTALSPSIVSVTPNAGSARTQLFQFVYSDPAGYAAITTTQHLINASNTFTSACGVRYVAASNALQLTDDSGATWSALATLGSQTTLSNSQCSVDVANSSVVGSGTNLTVNVTITFNPNFIGTKNIYTLASNKFGVSTGLQQKGTWTLAALPPAVVSVTPSTGTGKSQAFQFGFSDPAGFAAISSTQSLINNSTSLANACGIRYIAASNSIQVTTDNGAGWSALAAIGTQATVGNSQCTVNLQSSSVSGTGTNLTLNLALTFSQTFTGTKTVYMNAINKYGLTTGYVAKGTWAP